MSYSVRENARRFIAYAEYARNVAQSLLAAAKNPNPVSDEEKARRLAICEGCEFLIRGKSDRCAKCGCFLKWKTALETWHCPIGKW